MPTCLHGPAHAPASASNHLPAQGWDTYHEAWDTIDPIDQCLDPTANAFQEHRELLRNCLRDTDAAIDKFIRNPWNFLIV
ncbi:hypothetical protein EWM64_g9251 [Hericium alpestre]|uniref:Uncharacterized protein n=1 Tax=Hericium alpestre TaxID=135208 RepID=A0A4Y9ZLR4_9AGAM|nr:hypothetical protein EWM64_g9251 [Hericium alpestre]